MKDIANFHKLGNKGKSFFVTRADFIFGNRMSAVCRAGFNARNIYIWVPGKNINTTNKISFFFRSLQKL